MTTCTVAFPGVSRLTYGVSIVVFAFFIFSSIPFNSLLGHEKAIRPKASAWSMGCSLSTSLNAACNRYL